MRFKGIVAFFAIVIIIFLGVIFWNTNGKEIYSNTYWLDMGSLRVKVYDNGKVMHDIEIESPNHQVNYKYYRVLNKDEINEIIENISDENTVYRIIYGKNFTGEVFDINN